MPENARIHYRTCNLCEAMCGLEITHRNGKILSIKGDKEDPFSKGYICPKAVALQDVYTDPDRLRKPVRKTNSGWQEISWKKAFDLVESGLKDVQNKYGNDAVAIYQGNPSVHNIGMMLFSSPFFKALRTKNRFSATSVDQLPHHFASQFMFGHSFLLPVPDINRTQYFFVLGANPVASNGSIMSASGMPDKIKALQARGGKMVVVDPRNTETALKADRHIFIKPGTDVFFLAAILHVLFKNGLTGQEKFPEWIAGKEKLKGIFDRFSPERVAEITGVPAQTVITTAKEFASASSAVCYGRMGVSTQQHGTLCQWLINLINIVTGNFDREGGAMFSNPAIDVVKFSAPNGTMDKYNRWHSRVRGFPEFGGQLPVAVLAEECLTAGEGQIKALVTSAGNPVLSTPNGRQLEKALTTLDFMVSIDIYINETTRFADIILPPATGLETAHYDLAFHGLAVHNTAKYSLPLFKPVNGARQDWQIYKELTRRMKKRYSFAEKISDLFITPSRLLNHGLKKGIYQLNLRKLKKYPHGIDLGPLKPVFPEALYTPDKKLHLAPDILLNGLSKLSLEPVHTGNRALSLIGRRHLRSNNSWMHNSLRLVKGPTRCTLMINPDDAKERNIRSGDRVTVTSENGKVELPAEVTEQLMPGVVSIPHGWGHHRSGMRMKTAEANPGVSINDLTDDLFVDEISGNAAFSGVKVRVALAD